METVSEEFIASFHSIPGFKPQEKYKNFYIFLNKTKEQNITDKLKNEVISELIPKNYLEEHFRLEVLIHFRKVDELMTIVKSENLHFINTIFKHDWFFHEAFKDVTGAQLICDILPQTSYSTRLKIINKLAKLSNNAQQMEEYFNVISNNYGMNAAIPLLSACRSEFIRTKLQEYKINFSPPQLLVLYKKEPELVLSYFEDVNNYTCKYKVNLQTFGNVLRYIATTNPKLFLELVEKYAIKTHIGRHATKKIITCDKGRVTRNARKFVEILEPKQTMKTLSGKIDEYFLNLFPKCLKDFPTTFKTYSCGKQRQWNGSLHFLMKYVPDKKKGDLLLNSFFLTYKSNVWYHKDFVTEELLTLLRPEQREICIAALNDELDTFIHLHEIKKSISMIKQKLRVTSFMSKRTNLLRLLVRACGINKDEMMLKDVCEYYVSRHRNESPQTHLSFLEEIANNFDMAKLGDEVWINLKEPIAVVRLNYRKCAGNFCFFSEIVKKYIHYRFLNNLSVDDDELEDVLIYDVCYRTELNILTKFPQYEKYCISRYGEIIARRYEDEELVRACEKYAMTLINFNQRNPKEEISVLSYPEMWNTVFTRINSNAFFHDRSLIYKYFICNSQTGSLKTEILQLFWNNLSKCYNTDILFWLIRNEPDIIFENSIKVVDGMPSHCVPTYRNQFFCKFFTAFKSYNCIQASDKLVKYCLDAINTEKYGSRKENSLLVLSVMMSASDFLNLIEPYLPHNNKIDATDKIGQEKLELHTIIIQCLRNIIPPSLIQKHLLLYTSGDYLKIVLPLLYYASSHISANNMYAIVNELLGRAVSVRKHGIKLAAQICTTSRLRSILMKSSETEKNSTIRSCLVREIFKFFRINPSDEIFELIKLNLQGLDLNESEAFDVIEKIDLMPEQYLGEFVQIIWNTLVKFSERGKFTGMEKYKLLCRIDKNNIDCMKVDFCSDFIASNIFIKEVSVLDCEAQNFVCKYLFHYTKVDLEQRALLVLNVIKDYYEKTQDTVKIGEFVKTLCQQCCAEKDKNILSEFRPMWIDIINPHRAFDVYLHFQFSLNYVDSLADDNILDTLGNKLGKYCSNLITSYGATIINVLCDALVFFVCQLPNSIEGENAKNIYLVMQSFLKNNFSVYSAVIVIDVLSKNISEDARITNICNDILVLLRSVDDPVVQLSINYKLKQFIDQNKLN